MTQAPRSGLPLPPLPAIPPVPKSEPRALSIPSVLVSDWTRELLLTISAGSPRAMQAEMGSSEIGQLCDRQIAYRLAGTPSVNHADPLKSLIGVGTHEAIRRGIERLNTSGRYLIEQHVVYRGVPGTLDLYDTWRHRVFDWKTTSKSNIARYRNGEVSRNYLVQIAIYAEGLKSLGYRVDECALVFIPRDGDLSDVWSWVGTANRELADEAVDRYDALRLRIQNDHHSPAVFDALPGPLCTYCSNYSPRASDLTLACPGKGVTA